MSYFLKLSDGELETLGWATNRGYFPRETYDAMQMTDAAQYEADGLEVKGERTDKTEFEYEIPEHAAWAITMQREDDPHSLFTCIGGALLEKLIKLENSIV